MADLLSLKTFITAEQLSVSCPYCFSPAGEMCSDRNGKPIAPHHERSVVTLKKLGEKVRPYEQEERKRA
jgi:hypothetical protein